MCVRLLVFEVSLGYMVDHFKNVAHLSAKYRAEERTLPTRSLMEIILLLHSDAFFTKIPVWKSGGKLKLDIRLTGVQY